MRLITSMYWRNIAPRIIADQKAAFARLGYDIVQVEANRVRHGIWMDQVLAAAAPDDLILFVDIDCIALTAEVIERAFAAAEAGELFGAAQTANHLPDRDFIYPAPMFLALSKATWDRIGRVSMLETDRDDVGMALSRAAVAAGVRQTILMPSFVCRPVWPLADRGCSGIGTFYQGEVFHLFQSRMMQGYDYAFHYVAGCVARGQPIDYVALHARMNSPAMAWSNRWALLKRKLRKMLGLKK